MRTHLINGSLWSPVWSLGWEKSKPGRLREKKGEREIEREGVREKENGFGRDGDGDNDD